MENLQWISIIDNNIRVVTKDILALKYLNSLNLNNNKIGLLPDFNNVNTSLTSLQLYSNELKSIPEGIEKLKSLKQFLVGDNMLYSLPDAICNMKSLASA